MYNWSTDVTKFKTTKDREIWELEQLINYGLNGQKIKIPKLLKYWNKINIDPSRRKFLQRILKDELQEYSYKKTNRAS